MPEPGRTFSDADLPIEGLNPAFLRSRGIVLLNRKGTWLTVGCADGLTDGDRAALQFATGLDIKIAALPTQKIEAGSETAQLSDQTAKAFQAAVKGSSAQVSVAPNFTHQTSLMDMIGLWLHRYTRSTAPFAPLAKLLEAGYSPRVAGETLIGTNYPVSALDPSLAVLAKRLATGATLRDAVDQDTNTPRWLHLALAASHSEAGQIAAFVRLINFDRTVSVRLAEIQRQRLDCFMLWVATVLIWFVVATWAGLLVTALALAGTIWLRDLSASHHRSHAMRARVLGMLEAAASLDLPPSAAIRASMASLNAVSPTWGALPDTRDGLANALELPPLFRALLMKGTLGEAASLAASEHTVRSDAELAWSCWLNSRVATGLFAAALAALVAQ